MMIGGEQELIESFWIPFEPVVKLLHNQTPKNAAGNRMEFLNVRNGISGKVEDPVFHAEPLEYELIKSPCFIEERLSSLAFTAKAISVEILHLKSVPLNLRGSKYNNGLQNFACLTYGLSFVDLTH
jgi:hypothetical protein